MNDQMVLPPVRSMVGWARADGVITARFWVIANTGEAMTIVDACDLSARWVLDGERWVTTGPAGGGWVTVADEWLAEETDTEAVARSRVALTGGFQPAVDPITGCDATAPVPPPPTGPAQNSLFD